MEGEGANQKRSPQFQTWQYEDRVTLDVDVEARLLRTAVVWSAVSGDGFFADDFGRRGICRCIYPGWIGLESFVVFKTGGKTYSSESPHSQESLLPLRPIPIQALYSIVIFDLRFASSISNPLTA